MLNLMGRWRYDFIGAMFGARYCLPATLVGLATAADERGLELRGQIEPAPADKAAEGVPRESKPYCSHDVQLKNQRYYR